MTVLLVTYPTAAGTRFDTDYYRTTHVPLVVERWSPYGLVEAKALFPVGDNPAYHAVAMLTFRDATALAAAIGSPEAADVFGDVPKFTDIAPVAQHLQ